jgi:hypothetical protein
MKITLAIISVFLLSSSSLLLAADIQPIVGHWQQVSSTFNATHPKADETLFVDFQSDGKAVTTIINNNGAHEPLLDKGSYSTPSDTHLIFQAKDTFKTRDFTFSIKDNTLIITDSKGATATFKRV